MSSGDPNLAMVTELQRQLVIATKALHRLAAEDNSFNGRHVAKQALKDMEGDPFDPLLPKVRP